jgi:hypothetical protein
VAAELDVGLAVALHVIAGVVEGAEGDGEQAVGQRGLAKRNVRCTHRLECALDGSRSRELYLRMRLLSLLSQSGHEVEQARPADAVAKHSAQATAERSGGRLPVLDGELERRLSCTGSV